MGAIPKNSNGELLCTQAEGVFTIKKAAVKNQSNGPTSLQAEFSTGDYTKTSKQTVKLIAKKRIYGEDTFVLYVIKSI
ncbi:hypothetical protein BGZ65_010750 [Modicella reniformis]|uniref:Uncharacterized protein n=1 Tax=Modicella reniformis TaxID=1440133 RepID=A0A9P6LVJ1_9FUNG|nr:hypothetical protein BGZ65_010750 [Modicella reniformis]